MENGGEGLEPLYKLITGGRTEESGFLLKLSVILYDLFHINVDAIDADDLFSDTFIDCYRNHYTGQEIVQTIETLKWALAHKSSYDFSKLLPGLPFSNDEIITYMRRLLDRLDSSFDTETLELLSVPLDDRELNILVVDDMPYQGPLDIAFHKRTPYVVTTVYTGADALERISKERFDIIVLNLHSDVNNSARLLEGIRNVEQQQGLSPTPVLVLLEDEEEAYIQKLYENSCSAHLMLPVSVSLLLQEVYRLTS